MTAEDSAIPPPDVAGAGPATAAGPHPPADAVAQDATIPRRSTAPQGWTWKSQLLALGIAMVLFGLWLIGSPFLLDYSIEDGGAALNAMICGGIVVFLGVLRVRGVSHPAVGWVAVAIGLWLFASSFVFSELASEAWNARVLGALIFFLGMLGIAQPAPDPDRGSATADHRDA